MTSNNQQTFKFFFKLHICIFLNFFLNRSISFLFYLLFIILSRIFIIFVLSLTFSRSDFKNLLVLWYIFIKLLLTFFLTLFLTIPVHFLLFRVKANSFIKRNIFRVLLILLFFSFLICLLNKNIVFLFDILFICFSWLR